jgi:uncharacterized protein YoxC
MNTFQEGLVEAQKASRAESFIKSAVLGEKSPEDVETANTCIQAAQDADVEAYYLQSVIREAAEEVLALEGDIETLEKSASDLSGDALEDVKADVNEKKELLESAYSSLMETLNKVFGSVLDPQTALAQIEEARSNVIKRLAETFDNIKVADMDAGGATFYDSKADKSRNPVMDYLLGFELEDNGHPEENKSGVQVVPAQGIGTEDEEKNDLSVEPERDLAKPLQQRTDPSLAQSASVDHPDDDPGADKKNPQEVESENQTPDELSFRLDALDPETKEWKEVKKFKTLEEAKEKEKELKDEFPMLIETSITNLTTIADNSGVAKPEYETTPEGPEGDNDEQEVKEETTPGDYPKKASVSYKEGQWEINLTAGTYQGINLTSDPAMAAHIISRGANLTVPKAAKILRYTKDTKKAYTQI